MFVLAVCQMTTIWLGISHSEQQSSRPGYDTLLFQKQLTSRTIRVSHLAFCMQELPLGLQLLYLATDTSVSHTCSMQLVLLLQGSVHYIGS